MVMNKTGKVLIFVALGAGIPSAAGLFWESLSRSRPGLREAIEPPILGPERAPAPDPFAAQRVERSPLGQRFRAHAERYRGLSYAGLEQELGLERMPDMPLSFDPAQANHYERISSELSLSSEELDILRQRGVVSVDHERRFSMGSAYFSIYARDLPVLITTDSILHALHRSYDKVLIELETHVLGPLLSSVLESAHDALDENESELDAAGLGVNADDVDVYLTVARSLLAGAGAPGQAQSGRVGSVRGQRALCAQLLESIAGLELQRKAQTELYGGRRAIDYSQFRPRGHYSATEALARYFRGVSWLGRADLGFVIEPPAEDMGLSADVARERRNAALLSALLRVARQGVKLERASDLLDFMVGRADNAAPAQWIAALEAQGATSLASLGRSGVVEAVHERVRAVASSEQLIRSQTLSAPRLAPARAPMQVFQVLGQRSTLDSFVLSRVVYDSIELDGHKPERMLPRGLDAMAALGNDEAVRLLRPDLDAYHYAANLLAARRTIDEEPTERWDRDLYSLWLGALRTLDDTEHSKFLPEVMRGIPWQRKQLQTQLASWSELRHDTLLYAKQSYTAFPTCGYPAAYVEPYPKFYARLKSFATRASDFTGRLEQAAPELRDSPASVAVFARHSAFFREFGGVMDKLELLAHKELRAEPFTEAEASFVRRAIDITDGGSGPPHYDGWYTRLIYRRDWGVTERYSQLGPAHERPDAWAPTVADVHTSPGSDKEPPRVLEAGVGDVELLVVAIDNGLDRSLYVGPVYTYYEFDVAPTQRLTDEQWRAWIEAGKLPERPAFVEPLRAASNGPRALGPSAAHSIGNQAASDAAPSSSGEPSPGPFDRAAATELAESTAAPAADYCATFGVPAPHLRVNITFAPADGSVEKVEAVSVKKANTSYADCLERWFGRLWVPAFSGELERVSVRVRSGVTGRKAPATR